MKNMIEAYVKDYIHKNKKIMILLFVILFLLMPFGVFNISSIMQFDRSSSVVYYLIGVSCVSSCMLAFVLPLYNFKFMMKKRSCDLYFSLPIKRSRLFTIQYLLGLAFLWIPSTINYLLAMLIIIPFQGITALSTLMICWLYAMVFITILYTFFVFLTMKCNNFKDAVVVLISYTIIPLLIIASFSQFLSENLSQIMITNAYSSYEVFDISAFLDYLSLPKFLGSDISVLAFMLMDVIDYSFTATFITSFYWIIVGIASFYYGKKCFIQRKGEDAEQCTVSLFTFPFIIMIITICLVLFVIKLQSGTLVGIIVVLVLYLIMSFFAKRTLRLTAGVILRFVGILACAFTFSFVFINTSGFGTIKEIPNIDDVENVTVGFMYDREYNEDGEPIGPNKVVIPTGTKAEAIEQINVYDVTSDEIEDSDVIAYLLDLQVRLMDQQEVIDEHFNNIDYMNYDYRIDQSYARYDIDITYEMKDGKILERRYQIKHDFEADFDACFDKLLKQGHINLYTNKMQNIDFVYK